MPGRVLFHEGSGIGCLHPPPPQGGGAPVWDALLSTLLIHGWLQPRALASSDWLANSPDANMAWNRLARSAGDSPGDRTARRAGRLRALPDATWRAS